MPCATVHLILADRVLERWRDSPRRAPFSPSRPAAVDAFMHGALAPDMGFIPGTDRTVSEAAHYLDPADLTRRLLHRSRSEEEEAFAWGWATHVQGDVELHPLVGRAVGERLFGDRTRRVDAVLDVAMHVSLEVGLDIALARTATSIPPPPRHAFFRGSPGVEPLAGALADTYGVEWHPGQLVQTHRHAVRLTRWWPRALALLPLRPPGPSGPDPASPGPPDPASPIPPGPASPIPPGSASPTLPGFAGGAGGRVRRAMAAAMRRMTSEGSAAHGFFRPEAPRRWFFQEVLRQAEAFAERFQILVDDGLAGMANLNLETGGPAGPGRGHAATDAIVRELAARRAPARLEGAAAGTAV